MASNVLSTSDLKRMLDHENSFVLLDVRNEDEVANWKILGRHAPASVCVPYFSFMEDADGSAAKVPTGKLVVAVCAKGGSSAWVADEVLRPRGYEVINLEGGMAGWGEFYDVHPIAEATGAVRVWQLERPSRGCLHHIIAYGGKQRGAIVIDPPRHIEKILDLTRREGLTITHIFDTHAHADHISGGPALAKATGAPYHLHPYDAIHPLDMLPSTIPFHFVEDGQEFNLDGAKLRVIHAPGHTLGNTALLLTRDGADPILFSGDTIFLRSIARPDLGGKGETWAPIHYRSLYEKLLTLPDNVLVLPGHFSCATEARTDGSYAARLGDLRRTNPELVTRTKEAFVQHILSHLPVFPPQYVDIKRVNVGLLQPDEEKSKELELGRNVCALSGSH